MFMKLIGNERATLKWQLTMQHSYRTLG